MISILKKHFTLEQFGLREEEPEIFVTSQWQHRSKPSSWYMMYRWFVAIYFLVTLLLSIILVKEDKQNVDGYRVKWFIYLTNWGYSTCTFQALLAAVMITGRFTTHSVRNCKFCDVGILRLYKAYWVANTTALVLACGISVIYWSFIYDPKKNDLDVMNFFVHALNTVVMVIDFFIVSHPVRLAHCFYPMAFVLVYATFSVIYYLAGGTSREGTTYIYPILNWNKPFRTILVCFGVGVFFVFLQSLFVILNLLKKKLHSGCGQRNTMNLAPTMTEFKNHNHGYVNEGVILGDQTEKHPEEN